MTVHKIIQYSGTNILEIFKLLRIILKNSRTNRNLKKPNFQDTDTFLWIPGHSPGPKEIPGQFQDGWRPCKWDIYGGSATNMATFSRKSGHFAWKWDSGTKAGNLPCLNEFRLFKSIVWGARFCFNDSSVPSSTSNCDF